MPLHMTTALSQTSTQSTNHVFPLLQPAVPLLNCFIFRCCSCCFVFFFLLHWFIPLPIQHTARFTLLTLVTFRRYNKIYQRHIARERDSAAWTDAAERKSTIHATLCRYIWGGCDILCSTLHQFSAIRCIIPAIYYSGISISGVGLYLPCGKITLRASNYIHNIKLLNKVSQIY